MCSLSQSQVIHYCQTIGEIKILASMSKDVGRTMKTETKLLSSLNLELLSHAKVPMLLLNNKYICILDL